MLHCLRMIQAITNEISQALQRKDQDRKCCEFIEHIKGTTQNDERMIENLY